jgi:4,5-DOPA dioxygenase extradiol
MTYGKMPALYLGHGAPPLVDDAVWTRQLAGWARSLPRPTAILVVSAHWESAPLTIGATETGVPLTYDFWGFPERYYRTTYRSPGAPQLAAKVKALLPDTEPVAEQPNRGLDHGAYVPLTVMYPRADIPVLQISMPALDPTRLLELGRRAASAARRGRTDHRKRLSHPRTAVPAPAVPGPAGAGLVGRLRRVGGRGAGARCRR